MDSNPNLARAFEPRQTGGERPPHRAVSRRECLGAGAGLVWALSGRPSFALFKQREKPTELEKWLLHDGVVLLGDIAALRRLGAVYLSLHPQERDRERLSQLLLRSAKPAGLSLLEEIARDWFEHEVIVVQGWVLARTEARICAALHLISGARE